MNKKDVKDGIKAIQLTIKEFKENYESQLEPLKKIKEHVEKIKEIEENNSIDLQIDWEQVEGRAIRDIITDCNYYTDIVEKFDFLESDLENWTYEVSDNKAEQIRESYIDPLAELKDSLSIDHVECNEDIDNLIYDLTNSLDEYFNN